MTVAGLATAAGIYGYGCSIDNGGSEETVKGTGSGSSTDTSLNLALSIVDNTGAQVRDNQFAAKTDVYIAVKAAVASKTIVSQDFVFQVADLKGNVVSSDDLACRTFHVDAKGNIDRVGAATDASGNACGHLFTTVAINGQAIGILQLAPFADVKLDQNGAMSFRVMVAPAAQCANGQFPQTSLTASFTIKAQTATCGNGVVETGEQCDDGNTTSGDGCSATCQSEGTHCCGNGVLDPGEECDDGNKKNNDGCNAHCQLEHTCCCGNGVLDPGEQCDDGNINDGDGCSHGCQLEGSGSGSGSGSGG